MLRLQTLLAPVLLLSLVACDGGGGDPTLQPIAAQTVRVNDVLDLTLPIDNPSGRAVEVSVQDPMLPSFDAVTSLSTTPGAAVFRWSPLASQTGTHTLTFVLSAAGGGELDRQDAIIEVLPSADAAPIFVRPGAGGTFDLERDPCVVFDVEVRDDDSASVEIGTRAALPERATLASAGPKRATFDWCPTPDQIASAERWTVQLYADDGDHPRVEHDYVVVLRTGERGGCPGAPPVINVERPVMGEAVTSGTTYDVEATVSDDMGLRDAPLLYYTTTEPASLVDPDVTLFEQVSFEATGPTYTARIPSLGLAEGEMEEVFFLVSATDNDDSTGSLCDHRSDSDVVSFFAVGGMSPDGSSAQCDACSASLECASGICAAGAGGGRCVDACSDTDCTLGTCGATVTTEGGVRAGCGPTSEVCAGMGMCTDDAREDDDTLATASVYSAAITDGQICAADEDHFGVAVGMGDAITVTLDGFSHASGDLDLELLASDGTILGTSASVRDSESVTYCNGGAATTLTARVLGFGGAENAYSFRADVAPDPGGCCLDDTHEDDDSTSAARSLFFVSITGGERGDFDGTICAMDDDFIEIPMTGAGRIEVDLLFTHADGDIDMTLFDPAGATVRTSASATDDESIAVDVTASGTYVLRVYGFRFAPGAGNLYLGEVRRLF